MFEKKFNIYIGKNDDIISEEENILHEINGIVLGKTSDGLFDLNGIMIKEVIDYCKSKGYDPDKVFFLTSYEIDFSDNRSVERLNDTTLVKKQKNRMESDSEISIVQIDGKIIARVFMGSSIRLDKLLWKEYL